MRKAVVATAGVAVVLVGGVLAAAAYSGRAVTAQLDEQTAALTRRFPALKVIDQKVEHGLFSSTRSFTLQLGCAPEALQQVLPGVLQPSAAPAPLQIHWRDVIHHAPLPAGHLGLASIDSELVSPAAYKARIEQLTDKQPLLSVHTAIDLSGGVVSDLTVPALHYSDATGSFTSKPVKARVITTAATSAGQGGRYSSVVPGLEFSVRAADGTSLAAKAGPITTETVVAPRSDATTWFVPSKVTGRLSALTVLGTAAKGTAVKPVQATFGVAAFMSESTLEQGLFSTHSEITGKALINDVALDKIELAASLKRLHAATYQKLVSTLIGTMFSCDPKAQQAALDGMFAEAQKELFNLLVHNPEYGLDKLAVELGGKRAELSYSVGTQGVTAADSALPLPAVLLTKGVLRISAKAHTELIAQAVKQLGAVAPAIGAAAGMPASPGQADQTLSFVNGMVDQFAQLGYLERDGDNIKASAAYEAGQVLVNGKPMALPDLGALGK